MSSTRSTIRGVYFVAITALVLAIVAFFFPLGGDTNIGAGGGISPTTSLLSIYSDQIQSPLPGGAWTNVVFNNNLITSDAWTHIDSSTQVIAARTGVYRVYFSIQAQVINPDDVVLTACKGCNLRYSIKGSQQLAGNGTIFEVPGSLTYSSGLNFFLSKEFLIEARVGDIFRFQFKSLCSRLTLYPFSFVLPTHTAVADETPISASLIISL